MTVQVGGVTTTSGLFVAGATTERHWDGVSLEFSLVPDIGQSALLRFSRSSSLGLMYEARLATFL